MGLFSSDKKKNLDSALEAAKLAVAKDKRTYFLHTLGYVHWMMGNYDEAIKCNEQVLEIDPNYKTAQNDIKKIKKEMYEAATTEN